MKKLNLFLLLSLVVFFSTHSNSTKAPRMLFENNIRYVLKTNSRSPLEMGALSRELISKGYDVAGHNWRKGEIEIITNESGISALNKDGLTGRRSLEQDLDPQYLNPAKLEEKLKKLANTYVHMTRLEQIGTSIQGRPVYALLISSTPKKNDPAALNKPSIIFDGVHHAREVMTAEIVADVAEELLTKHLTNPQYKNIVENWMVWVVPILNVDGSNIVFTENSWWRKNAHITNGDLHGVDLNRNYSFNWNSCDGSSGSISSETYRGTAGGSEPEAKALMDLAALAKPTASLSYHSYSELILYPYGCNGVKSAEHTMIEKIANELSVLLPTDDGTGNYTPGTPWELLYDVDGDSMDHIHATHGSLAYTFEVNESFQPEYSLREPTLLKHRKAWSYFFDRMNKNLLTVTTINAKTGLPEAAQIEVDTIVHKNKELPFTTNTAGKFFKVLDPGVYVITAKLNSGKQVSASVNMKGNPQSVTITIPQ